jgi:hypothetical protein
MVTRAVECGGGGYILTAKLWFRLYGRAWRNKGGHTKFDLTYWQLKLGVLFVSQVNWARFEFFFAAALIKIQIIWNMTQRR